VFSIERIFLIVSPDKQTDFEPSAIGVLQASCTDSSQACIMRFKYVMDNHHSFNFISCDIATFKPTAGI
jgi:hypothetical protein